MSAPWTTYPIDMAASQPVKDLVHRTGRRDARLLLLDLWAWAKRHAAGGIVRGSDPARQVEEGANWRGKRGAFVESAIATGFLQREPGGIRIVPWEAVISVEWAAIEVSADSLARDAELPAPRPAKSGAERTKEWRQKRAKANVTGDASVTPRDAASVTPVTKRDGDCDAANVTGDASVTPRDVTNGGVRGGDLTQKETETQTETHTNASVRVTPGDERKPAHSHEANPDRLRMPFPEAPTRVFAAWRDSIAPGQTMKVSDFDAIQRAFAKGETPEGIIRALAVASKDPWRMDPAHPQRRTLVALLKPDAIQAGTMPQPPPGRSGQSAPAASRHQPMGVGINRGHDVMDEIDRQQGGTP